MVVVAIIGILSAVAIPQFQKFQRKAKQSEARANLAAIYTAQKTFLVEKGKYYPNLWAIGYEPEGDLLYGMAMDTTGATAFPGASVQEAPTLYNLSLFICGREYADGISANCRYTPLADPAASTAWRATATTFMAGARGRLISPAGPEDRWTINQLFALVNIINGVL